MRQGLEQVSEGQAGEPQGAKVFASGRREVRRGTALPWGPESTKAQTFPCPKDELLPVNSNAYSMESMDLGNRDCIH